MKKVKSAGSKVYEAITTKEAKCMKQVKSAGSKLHEARKKFMKQVKYIKQVKYVKRSSISESAMLV